MAKKSNAQNGQKNGNGDISIGEAVEQGIAVTTSPTKAGRPVSHELTFAKFQALLRQNLTGEEYGVVFVPQETNGARVTLSSHVSPEMLIIEGDKVQLVQYVASNFRHPQVKVLAEKTTAEVIAFLRK